MEIMQQLEALDVKNTLFLCHVLKNNVKKAKLVAG